MTNANNLRRGMTRYCVLPSYSKTTTPFFVVLRHSRERDVLEALIRAGADGCSLYNDPAPRWAASIHRLRKRGIDILTVREAHGGEHPGHHARYYLISMVACVPEGRA